MSNVYSIITGQPIITANDAIRITSASKPQFVALPAWITVDPELNRKAMKLQTCGWKAAVTYTGMVFFSNEVICPGECLTLENAWKAQVMSELGERYWGQK